MHDVVVMGGGHNGLIAAAYLAKAGKQVVIVERREYAGGGVLSRELNVPGYRHDVHSSVHIMIQGNPMIRNDELELFSRFGLRYNYSDVPYASIFQDQRYLITYKDLDRSCEAIAHYSARDAEAYRRFAERSIRMLPLFVAGMYSPPPPLGAFLAMLDQSEEGREVLEAITRSSLDIVNALFESDLVKMHLLRLVCENLQMPDELGTGTGIFLMPGIIHTYGVSQPVGGSGGLTDALLRCLAHHGVEIRYDAEVDRVLVSGGRAVGVCLTSGEELRARDAVIAAIHPHRLRRFVAGVPEPVLARAERVTTSTFSLMASHYALKRRAEFYAGKEVSTATMLEYFTSDNLPDMLEDFDDLRRGRIPARPLVAGTDDTHADPSRAPPGAGIFHSSTFAPYRLRDGGPSRWDEIKEQVADQHLEVYRRFTPSLTEENILARTVWSPLDMERHSPNSFVNGDMHGAAPFLHQSLGHRPTPDLGQFTVPGADRLYLVGPYMHPGGGVFGAGRATAIKAFEELGMNFDATVTGA